MISTRSILKDILTKTVLTVEFKKADDIVRKMDCTLHPDFLPDQVVLEESDASPLENLEILVVWDVESNNWRILRLESVVTVVLKNVV
jgi:hypothetical protein